MSAAQPAAGYGARPLREYLADMASDPPLLVGQIETATTDDPLDVLAGPLDAMFLGTTDLAVDLGVAGEPAHAAVTARIEEVAAATRRAGAVLGGWAAGPEAALDLIGHGATYLVIGSDLQALQSGLGRLRPCEGGPAA